jgi:hypothetical protein
MLTEKTMKHGITMNASNKRKRIIQLWIGISLLSITALFWLALISGIISHPEGRTSAILSGSVFSIIPIKAGIYYVKRAKRKYKRRLLYW